MMTNAEGNACDQYTIDCLPYASRFARLCEKRARTIDKVQLWLLSCILIVSVTRPLDVVLRILAFSNAIQLALLCW